MSYQDKTVELAEASRRTAMSVVATWRTGRANETAMIASLAANIYVHNSRATGLADLALAAAVTQRVRRPVVPLGLWRPDDRPRLADAVTTIIEVADDPAEADMRIGRLARAEPLTAGREAMAEGMRRRRIPGWTRQASADACELCRSLADGTVLPPDIPMVDHPGCSCVAVPVL